MHPLWQIKQINTVDGQRYVDRCNAFGSSASGALFIAFNALVSWIATRERGIDYLATYVDDSSGFDMEGNTTFYEPYNTHLPFHQAVLLRLWDDIGVPHKPKKQVHGCPLTVIGINVDPNAMTFTLPETARTSLLEALRTWAIRPVEGQGRYFKLKYWQKTSGWINWALNIYPLLRPCLNNFYPKTSGVHNPSKNIRVNYAI